MTLIKKILRALRENIVWAHVLSFSIVVLFSTALFSLLVGDITAIYYAVTFILLLVLYLVSVTIKDQIQ